MNKECSISVILPVYNEEDSIEKVIKDSVNFLHNQDILSEYELIAVNDGSSDNTAEILDEFANKIPYLRVITHSKNLGYGKALMSGVKNSKCSLVLFMDADGQFNITEIRKFLPYIRKNSIITGCRYKRKDAFYRIILGKIYNGIVSLLFKLKLNDINCGFKLFKKEILNDKYIYSNAGVFYTEILFKARKAGYKIKEIQVEHSARLKGKPSGAKPKVIVNAIIDLVKLIYFQRMYK